MKEQWEYNILRCIDLLSGEACLEDIYDKIAEFVELTEEHRRKHYKYKEPKYHIQVRAHIGKLCQKGELEWISKGCYSLTEEGRKRLKRGKPTAGIQRL